jgi:hypothetical protein
MNNSFRDSLQSQTCHERSRLFFYDWLHIVFYGYSSLAMDGVVPSLYASVFVLNLSALYKKMVEKKNGSS